jgi:hypothetical protein
MFGGVRIRRVVVCMEGEEAVRSGSEPSVGHKRVGVPFLAADGHAHGYETSGTTARIVEGGAPALLKKLAKVMLGSDEHFPPPNAPEGLLTRVRIEKVGGLGPWTS